MKGWRKFLLAAVLIPPLMVGGYVAFLAATYIDETVVSGSAYGFSIGSSKQQALEQASSLRNDYPDAVIYVFFGPRAGDRFHVAPVVDHLDRLEAHDRWNLQLEGPSEYRNGVSLRFVDDGLVEIHRYRQYFEGP